MILAAIVARAENGVIGREGELPWHLGADLKRFKATTWGHPIVMGRRTYESIGRPLPGRTNVVLTRDPNFRAPGCVVLGSLDEALDRFADQTEVFVIGGQELYRAALPKCQRLHVTQVHASVEGDAFFPDELLEDWVLHHDVRHPADAANDYPFSFRIYERGSEPVDATSIRR